MQFAIFLSVVGVALGEIIPHSSRPEPASYSKPGVRFRGINIPQPHAQRKRNVDIVASNHLVMQKSHSPMSRQTWQKSLRKEASNGWDLTAESNWTKPATSNMTFMYNSQYIVPITIGNQELQVIVDTGSGDTWAIQNNFTCIDQIFGPIEEYYCSFGPTFNGSFSHGLVPGAANFSFTYGDGSYVSGQVGYEDVTIAGVTVKKQEILLATEAAWTGDGTTSGILGLSYPLETRIFSNATSIDQNFVGSSTHRKYDPIFTSMYKQGLVSPTFSMAMNRSSQKGWLAFGGLPPVDHAPEFAKTPIRIVGVDNSPATKIENSYYTIIPDGFVYGNLNTKNFSYSNPSWNGLFNDTNNSQFPVMIDTGATFAFLPKEIVRPYVLQFTPPVGLFGGQYWAPCNAKVPPFGVTIGGKTLYISEADLLQQEVRQEQSYRGTPITVCLIGLMDIFPNGPFVFGDMFLNNFVTVFDVGGGEMRFYPRI